MFRVTILATGLALLTVATSAEDVPIRLHPDNPHYFLFHGEPTVLITSGEHYGAVLNLDFDDEKYLDELAANGLNLTRTFSGVYVESWGEPWNTLNPKPGRYCAPWARGDEKGYADGGNKFDLNHWDKRYFRRLKDFVSEAGERDIVVEFVLFCVFYDASNWKLSPLNIRNNINKIGTASSKHFFDESDRDLMKAQARFVRKVVRELKGFDNVYFELCNEPYFKGPKLHSAWNKRMVKAIRSVTDEHMIAINVANNSKDVKNVPTGVDVLNFHYARPPRTVGMNYGLNKAVAYDESGFKGPKADNYRRYAWDFIIAGGATFDNLDWSFTVDSERGHSHAADEGRGCQDPAIRPQLGHLLRFMQKFDFIDMHPDNKIIQGGVPTKATARALVERGEQYAIYINGGHQADLKIQLPAGSYSVKWFNTKQGKVSRQKNLRHDGGTVTLSSPRYTQDIALRIMAQN